MSPRNQFLNKKMLAGGHPFAACCSVALRPLGAAEVFHQRTGCRRWAAHAKRRGEVHPVLLVYGVTHCAMPHQVIVVTLFQNVSLFLNKKKHNFSSLSLLSPPPRRRSALTLAHPSPILFSAGLHACPIRIDPGVDVLLRDSLKLSLNGLDELSLGRRSTERNLLF